MYFTKIDKNEWNCFFYKCYYIISKIYSPFSIFKKSEIAWFSLQCRIDDLCINNLNNINDRYFSLFNIPIDENTKIEHAMVGFIIDFEFINRINIFIRIENKILENLRKNK